ncbi:hypothetical protein [Rickettsia felis]|nr:hypothetical protein [Rickettsia felis]
MAAISFQQGIIAWIPPRHYERLRRCCMARKTHSMSFPRKRG